MLDVAAYLDMIPTFLLVACRISGLFLMMPFFADMGIPVKVKVLVSLGVTIVVVGQVPPVGRSFPGWPMLAAGMAGELGIGLAMGLVVSLLFAGLAMGGEMVSQQTGMSLATLYDPASNANTPIYAQLYTLLGTVIFLGINGHHRVIEALLDSFQKVPLLGVHIGGGIGAMLGGMLQGCFVIGLKVAAPAMTALLLESVAIGFLQRTVPQLNILAVGFPLRLLVGTFMLVVSLFAVMTFFQDELAGLLSGIGEVVKHLSP
jgi:flagellar biosynthetic protein FliR